MLNNIENSLNILNIALTNLGDYNISKLAFECFNEKFILDSDVTLKVGETKYLEVSFYVMKLTPQTKLKATAYNNDIAVVEAEYSFTTLFADVSIDGEMTLINGKQNFILTVTNSSVLSFYLEYSVFVNGNLHSTQTLFFEPNAQKQLNVIFDYLNKDDYIYFSISPKAIDKSYTDNIVAFQSVQDEIKNDLRIVNKMEEKIAPKDYIKKRRMWLVFSIPILIVLLVSTILTIFSFFDSFRIVNTIELNIKVEASIVDVARRNGENWSLYYEYIGENGELYVGYVPTEYKKEMMAREHIGEKVVIFIDGKGYSVWGESKPFNPWHEIWWPISFFVVSVFFFIFFVIPRKVDKDYEKKKLDKKIEKKLSKIRNISIKK